MLCAHVFENLHRDQVSLSAPSRFLRKVLSWTQPEFLDGLIDMAFRKKIHRTPKAKKRKAALQVGSKSIELVTHRRFRLSSCPCRACSFSHTTPSRSTTTVDAIWLFEFRRRRKSCSDVRWTSTMYTVHQESGANQGETPGIGEPPSSQPISGPVMHIREVPPDVIFGLYELTLRLWKNGANSAVKCIRRLRLWACTHVEYGWVAREWPRDRCCKFHPADDVVFVFVFVLSVCLSRNRKSTCKNTAHPHVFVFVVCQSRNLSIFSKAMQVFFCVSR